VDPFGTDSDTSPKLNPLLTDFYIGRLGIGQTISQSRFFNISAARQVGPNYTYGYWGLVGPNNKPPEFPTFRDWGTEQAKKAIEAWTIAHDAGYVGGRTIFADVEPGFGGWGTNPQSADQQTANQEVLNGFLDHIFSFGFVPGVYINTVDITGQNNSLFGPDYARPSGSFVLWIAGKTCCLSICTPASNCNPCISGCDPSTAVEENWNNIVRNACWAGQGAVIWQFWIYKGCGAKPVCGDFDYSPERVFMPAPCTATPCLAGAIQTKKSSNSEWTGTDFNLFWQNSGQAPSSCGETQRWRAQSTGGVADHKTNNWGFNLPDGAVIDRIIVTVAYNRPSNNIGYNALKNDNYTCQGVTLNGTSFASLKLHNGGTSFYLSSGSQDLNHTPAEWGVGNTPDIVESNLFGTDATVPVATIISPGGFGDYSCNGGCSAQSASPSDLPVPLVGTVTVTKITVLYKCVG